MEVSKSAIYRVLCEWDLGQEGLVFTTHGLATKWAKEAVGKCGLEESYEELEDDGLISIDSLTLYQEGF